MPISELNQRRGFGSERLIVRGRQYLPLAQAALLRPHYNDYPERFPVNTPYPAPGRRGPSRPKADQTSYPVPSPGSGGNTYPPSRTRDERESSAPVLPSGLEQGESFFNSPGVVTGTDRIILIGRAYAPFVITHVEYWGANTSPNAGDGIGLKILADVAGSTSGDFDTVSGDVFEFINSQSSNILEPFNVVMQHWPNIFYPQAAFIKAAWRNTIAAGNTAVYLVVDVRYLR